MPEADFQLIETFLYTPGKDRPVDTLLYPPSPIRAKDKISDLDFALMKPHLMRMKRSAGRLGFDFGSQFARRSLFKAVKNYEAEHQTRGTLRVRLLLHENGALKIECFPFTADPEDKIISFAISDKRVQSDDKYLKHKTTRRALYDGEHARLSAETGCDEVLFLNERDELCEGSRSNLFIRPAKNEGEQADDATDKIVMLTPKLSSGLLPGVLREKIIRTKMAQEAILTMKDLESAEKIYFGNSVRGLQEAKICA